MNIKLPGSWGKSGHGATAFQRGSRPTRPMESSLNNDISLRKIVFNRAPVILSIDDDIGITQFRMQNRITGHGYRFF